MAKRKSLTTDEDDENPVKPRSKLSKVCNKRAVPQASALISAHEQKLKTEVEEDELDESESEPVPLKAKKPSKYTTKTEVPNAMSPFASNSLYTGYRRRRRKKGHDSEIDKPTYTLFRSNLHQTVKSFLTWAKTRGPR
jgi:hypothetical protein